MAQQNNEQLINQDYGSYPIYPRVSAPGRVFLVWDISYRCNYNCSYCPTHESLMSEDSIYISMNKMQEISYDMYKRYSSCHIRFSGGEPFIYPNFIEFLQELSEFHTLEVSTNLSMDVNELKKKLRPEGILLSTSFHPEFVNIHEFLKKISFLKNNKFNVSVTYVAYPPFLKQLGYYKEIIEKKGIQFIIQLFNGSFGERVYPDAYTDEERILLKDYVDTSLHRSANRRIFEHKTNEEKKRIKNCRMGQMYAKIDRFGDIFRCCAKQSPKLGNIFRSGLTLLNEAMFCEIEPCVCWKAMIVGREESWFSQWEYPKHPKQYEPIKEKKNNIINQSIYIPQRNLKAQIPPHRVFITWDIHYNCNYKCSYCNAQKPGQDNFIEARYIEVGKWIAIWNDIYKRYGSCEIQLTGGEPFVYPEIMDLITQLSKIHTLEFSTNFSWDVEPFIKNIAPDRARVGISFHPEFIDFNLFLDKALRLKNSGFEVWVNYVAYPPLLKYMSKYKLEVEKAGMNFSILPFTGTFDGRLYPDEYLESERKIMNSDCDINPVNKKTIDWRTGEQKNTTKGKLCRMGQMYAKIHPDGEAYRCCGEGSSKLGNLIDETFELLEEPAPCECEQCPCWRCMLVGQEKDWSSHWIIPKKKD
jgi:MoaA/NifB/PqqE/SkfB family radical SAM enzyme